MLKNPTTTKDYSKWLIVIPLLTYAISYIYLAYYHSTLNLWPVIIHEGGRYTLLETVLYASHFLGHVYVHVTLSFLFVGCFCLFHAPDSLPIRTFKTFVMPIVFLIIFLLISIVISLHLFGREETFSYLLQKKQSVTVYAQGGSWNLHLPSTMMLFLLIPAYLYVTLYLIRRSIGINLSGFRLIGVACLLFIIITICLNHDLYKPIKVGWTDPRYLAHSVRELATFPLTYFPLALCLLLKNNFNAQAIHTQRVHSTLHWKLLLIVALVFLVLFIYQCLISLKSGISNLAQKPTFAKDGQLGVPYLLASHYFEHVLDTIFFACFCYILVLFRPGNKRREL